MNTNLVTLWSVQPASGLESVWFTSEAEARKKFEALNSEVDAAFAAWERGEPGNSAVVQSYLEGDCFGCVESFRVSPHARPHWREWEPGTLKHKPDGIPARCWGNPATARPERRPVQV